MRLRRTSLGAVLGCVVASIAATGAAAVVPGLTSAPVVTRFSGPDGLPEDAQVVYRSPVEGPVMRLFEPPAQRWSAGHRGVDLSAPVGTSVTSPAAGVVTFAGPVAGRGVVTVRHADGLRSSLEPVEASVTRGEVVALGSAIGTLQARPEHEGVHWGVRRGTEYLDPLSLLRSGEPVVLLPLDGG